MIDTNILRAVILTLISPVVIANYLLAEQLTRAADIPKTHNPHPATQDSKLDKAAFIQKTQKLRVPFIANNGQVDEQVRFLTAGSGLQPEPSGLLNTDVCANDVISKDINTGVQVANLNPQKDSMQRPLTGRCS